MKSSLRLLLPAIIGFMSIFSSENVLAAKFKGPIGLQLYSLRADFAKNVPATLDKVQSFGIKYVELAGTYNLSAEQFNKELAARKLKAISGHFPYERYKADPEGVAREAKALGLKYAGCAWIPHEGDFDENECRAAAAVFNNAGKILAKNGIQFFYHTHGYEFRTHGDGTLFDLLMKATDPKTVHYEMDVFWIVHPGQDPAKLLQRYGKRWVLMHVKDMKKGTPTGLLTGHTDVNNDVALGTGTMDWPPILEAAKKVGIKYYFIEDESSAAAEHIPQSLRFLDEVKW